MAIVFSCGCGKSYSVPETFAGKKARCALCGNVNTVPVAKPEPEAVPVLELPPAAILNPSPAVAETWREAVTETLLRAWTKAGTGWRRVGILFACGSMLTFWVAGAFGIGMMLGALPEPTPALPAPASPPVGRNIPKAAPAAPRPVVPLWTNVTEPIVRGPATIRVVDARIKKSTMSLLVTTIENPIVGLEVVIDIENTSETTKFTYKLWDESIANVTDEFGNVYKYTLDDSDSPVGRTVLREETLDPGHKARDILVFERPVEKAKRIRLELPNAQIEGSQPIRFEIPRSFLER